MEETMGKKKKSKQDLFYDEAQSLFITGWELEKIARNPEGSPENPKKLAIVWSLGEEKGTCG